MFAGCRYTAAAVDDAHEPRSHLAAFLDHTRLHVLAAVVVAFALFWAVGAWAGVPTFPGDASAILTQPGAVGNLLAVAATLALATAAGVLLTAIRHKETGWAAAVFGLSALALRGGPMREEVLGHGPGVWLGLLGEVALLYGLIAAAWLAFHALAREPVAGRPVEGEERELSQKLLATAMVGVFCGIVVLILARSDSPKQGLAAVVAGSLGGAYLVHRYIRVRPTAWLWMGPLIPAVAGYALAFFGDTDTPTGLPTGYFGPLARVSPLAWAVGPAAAFWGYRMSHATDREAAQKRLAEHAERERERESSAGSEQPATVAA